MLPDRFQTVPIEYELYDNFIAVAKAKFNEKYGHEPKIYDVVISDGAHKEWFDMKIETKLVPSQKGDITLYTLTNKQGASVVL